MSVKSTQVMIGDLYYSSFSNEPCRVVGIREYIGGYVSILVDRVLGYKDITSLSQIQITEKILEKNGWTYNDENEKFHPDTWSGNGIMLRQENDCFRIVVVSDYDDEDTNDTPFLLRCVSELQLALKLLGEDKEIEI